MTTPKLVNISDFNDTLPETPIDIIKRDAYIDAIHKNSTKFDVLFIDGESGVGKTTLLNDFVCKNVANTISYFITPSYNFTYNPICFKENLYRQIFYYASGEVPDEKL